MMKVRRYLRGSGRVLAFVFVASVVWLLFDMAALRLSINDVNSQILKERVIRERELFKQQSLTKGSFKHPLQKENVAVPFAGKEVNSGVKVAEVYRPREKKQEQKNGDQDRKSVEPRRPNFTQMSHPNFLLPAYKGTILKIITTEKDVSVKNKVDHFDVNGIEMKKSLEMNASTKQMLPLVSIVTIQENKEPSPTLSEKESAKNGNVFQNTLDKTAAKATEGFKDGPKNGRKDGHLEPVEAHPAQTTSAPPNKDINMNKTNLNTRENRVSTAVRSSVRSAKDTILTAVGTEAGSKPTATAVRRAGVHKVQHLDATLVPRDDKALGQFGQAVLVSSREDAQVRKRWDEGFFNVYLSDQIPVDRAIPDTRPET